ncbi:P-type conjugative transfer ATPase TrbB, partial [Glycocaulis profundi]
MPDAAHHDGTETRSRAMLRSAFCGPIREALDAPDTIEIMANPDGAIWVERAGQDVRRSDA